MSPGGNGKKKHRGDDHAFVGRPPFHAPYVVSALSGPVATAWFRKKKGGMVDPGFMFVGLVMTSHVLAWAWCSASRT